ncbi:unnamed protein product [Taenia asiatica]|uniref:Uncharacterized protein n=1 Tax=Taenia asiatica TaxID=60517 RepID=A0A0R3WCN0_TAEAS|nr:unnamed protein product [Taenia asiatica]
MGRTNHKRRQPNPKKPNKKQMRKKQSAIVQRCIQALNSDSDRFRTKLSEPPKPPVTKPPDGSLKHFKPIRIEVVEGAALADAAALLESNFHLEEPDSPKEKQDS